MTSIKFATDFVTLVSFTFPVAVLLTDSTRLYLSSYLFKYELASQIRSGLKPAGSLKYIKYNNLKILNFKWIILCIMYKIYLWIATTNIPFSLYVVYKVRSPINRKYKVTQIAKTGLDAGKGYK